MDPTPEAPDPVRKDPGVDLLDAAASTADARRRAERAGNVGRFGFVALGAVTVGAAAGLWLSAPTPVDVGLLVFGGAMLGVGGLHHHWLRQERTHRPRQLLLWAEGVELVLENGEIRGAAWSDPTFSLDAYVRPGVRGRPEEVTVRWRMDRRIPLLPITSEGLDRLRAAAAGHGLRSEEYRGGGGRQAMRGYEFRAASPGPVGPKTPSPPEHAPG